MGRSVNKVILIGTLGRDPELRYMPNGNPVANITLATDESYNDKQTGQKVEQTEWHRLVVYGKLAEICQQYLHKGSKAYFEGRLKTREWEKDGIKRYTTEIVVADLTMLSPQQGGGSLEQYQDDYHRAMQHEARRQQPSGGYQAGGQPAQPAQGAHTQQPAGQSGQQYSPSSAPAPSNAFDDYDDDVPF